VASVTKFTCLVGTMVPEIYGTRSEIRSACEASISAHAAKWEANIADAVKRYRIRGRLSAASLALQTEAVLQGFHIGKGPAERGHCRREHRPPAPPYRTALSIRSTQSKEEAISRPVMSIPDGTPGNARDRSACEFETSLGHTTSCCTCELLFGRLISS
jgi:hypothetical protein